MVSHPISRKITFARFDAVFPRVLSFLARRSALFEPRTTGAATAEVAPLVADALGTCA